MLGPLPASKSSAAFAQTVLDDPALPHCSVPQACHAALLRCEGFPSSHNQTFPAGIGSADCLFNISVFVPGHHERARQYGYRMGTSKQQAWSPRAVPCHNGQLAQPARCFSLAVCGGRHRPEQVWPQLGERTMVHQLLLIEADFQLCELPCMPEVCCTAQLGGTHNNVVVEWPQLTKAQLSAQWVQAHCQLLSSAWVDKNNWR